MWGRCERAQQLDWRVEAEETTQEVWRAEERLAGTGGQFLNFRLFASLREHLALLQVLPTSSKILL